MEEILTHIFR